MDDRIDRLFQEWHRLGGAVLLAQVEPLAEVRPPEEVIAESTAWCRSSGRLTWVVLDWLVQRIGEVDERALLRKTNEIGDLCVLGVLCYAARLRNPHPKLDWVCRRCPPNAQLVPFFHRVARSPLASRLARENPVEAFRKWNYLCSELRYLSDRPAEVVGVGSQAKES